MIKTLDNNEPELFKKAKISMDQACLRNEITVSKLKSPKSLAPYSHAIALELMQSDINNDLITSSKYAYAKVILLYDPSNIKKWGGILRLVTLIETEIEPDIATDQLLPEVAWSWLCEAFLKRSLNHHTLRGAVTITTSVKFGDMSPPQKINNLEIRSSWTPENHHIDKHLEILADVMSNTSGLPPEGVTRLPVLNK